MTRRSWLFRAGAGAMCVAGLMHVAAIAIPSFGAVAYSAGYPLWRHLMWIAITTALAGLFLARPSWLIWPVVPLTVQMYYGHGQSAWRLWNLEGRIGWIDLITVVGSSVILVLLAVDRARRPAASPQQTASTSILEHEVDPHRLA
jgi:hypothetical protein